MCLLACLGLGCAIALPCMRCSLYRNPSLFISSVERDEIINPVIGNICILTPFNLLNVAPRRCKLSFPPNMASAKITDVKRDVFDSAQSGLNYLTSDQGVKVSDTDNW